MAVAYLETQIEADKNWLAANQQVIVAEPSGDLMAVGSCRRCLHDTQYPIDLEPVADLKDGSGANCLARRDPHVPVPLCYVTCQTAT